MKYDITTGKTFFEIKSGDSVEEMLRRFLNIATYIQLNNVRPFLKSNISNQKIEI